MTATHIRRVRAVAWTMVLATLALATAFASPVPAASTIKVSPVLECSFKDEKTGKYHSLFGSNNEGTSTVEIPIGASNKFTGTPSSNAGQPTKFAPGRKVGTFVVNHTGTIVWSLNGRTSTAPGKACGSDPVPFGITGVIGLAVLAAVGLLLIGVSFWWGGRRRRPRGAAT